MKKYLSILLLVLVTISCQGQSKTIVERSVGGPCEDCEATLDFEVLNLEPKSIDTLPGFYQNEPKIKITGTVFQRDGKTPAENVLLYVYHVNRKGIYQPSRAPMGWEKRHGQHRGWLKTDEHGKFTFYTFQPVPYPEVNEPAHIHIYVQEPHTTPYYLDSYLFESDSTLTEKVKQSLENRGGSGIVRLTMENGMLVANRNIILGLNIPGY